MIGIEPEMERKLASIGFRENGNGLGLGMRALVEKVEIVAVESPLGLHLTFTAHLPRKSAQAEVQIDRNAEASSIAQVIVRTIEESFSDCIANPGKGTV